MAYNIDEIKKQLYKLLLIGWDEGGTKVMECIEKGVHFEFPELSTEALDQINLIIGMIASRGT